MGVFCVGNRRDADAARRLLEDAVLVDEVLESRGDERSLDLDKAWHGVHRLMTGSARPTADVASEAVFGGEPIGEDLGYGTPARLSSRPSAE